MILTVSIPQHCAPQKVRGETVLPGQSVTADFDDAEVAAMLTAPGHFRISQAASGRNPPQVAANTASAPAEPDKPHRGRPPRTAKAH